MNYSKLIKKMFFKCYLHVTVFLSNIVLNMINYYDEKNVITFDERTKTIVISIQIKKEEED